MKTPEVVHTFGLVSGFGHGTWCWDLLRPQLEALGHESVAVKLPISDPDASSEDNANIAHGQLKAESNLVLVGHSRGANVIRRLAGKLATEKLIYLCGSFDDATLENLGIETDKDALPRKYSSAYEAGLYEIHNGLWAVRTEVAKAVYYNECEPNVKEWAASKLLPQRRTQDEMPYKSTPYVPQLYVRCTNDLALNADWSEAVARAAHIPLADMASDHSPFLSHPRELATALVAAAEGVSV